MPVPVVRSIALNHVSIREQVSRLGRLLANTARWPRPSPLARRRLVMARGTLRSRLACVQPMNAIACRSRE